MKQSIVSFSEKNLLTALWNTMNKQLNVTLV